MTETFRQIEHELQELYAPGEIRSFIRILCEHVCGIPYHRLLLDKDKQLSANEKQAIRRIVERLKQSEPIQYILGEVPFYDLSFTVAPGVLIPRPETEELIDYIIRSRSARKTGGTRILDIGTGSGCIAVTLARHLPGAEVWAADISEVALDIARRNAVKNGVSVRFCQADVLQQPCADTFPGMYDLVVSNPPYVTDSEKKGMQKNVLGYEPSLALFVPDADPLLFYKAISRLGKQKIRAGGFLYFEINARFGKETADLLEKDGYREVRLMKDLYGNDRIIEAQR